MYTTTILSLIISSFQPIFKLFYKKIRAQTISSFLYAMILIESNNFSIRKLKQYSNSSYNSLLNIFSKLKLKNQNEVGYIISSFLSHTIQKSHQAKVNECILILDDTAHRKRMRKNPSVSKQYIGNIGKVDNAISHVLTSIVGLKNKIFKYKPKSHSIRKYVKIYMNNFKTYFSKKSSGVIEKKVEYKSKIELGKELIDEALNYANQLGIKITHILFDAWYASRGLLSYIYTIGKKFICEIKKNRKVIYNGKLIPVSSLVTATTGSEDKVYHIILPQVGVVLLFFIRDTYTGRVRCIITNDFDTPIERLKVIARLRYCIEYCFRQMKSYFNMSKFHFTDPKKVEVYLMFVMLLYNFYEYLLHTGILKRQFGCTTLGKLKEVLNCEFIQHHLNAVNSALLKHFGKKSK